MLMQTAEGTVVWYEWVIKQWHEDWCLWVNTKNHRPITWIRTGLDDKKHREVSEKARAAREPYASGRTSARVKEKREVNKKRRASNAAASSNSAPKKKAKKEPKTWSIPHPEGLKVFQFKRGQAKRAVQISDVAGDWHASDGTRIKVTAPTSADATEGRFEPTIFSNYDVFL